MKHVIFRVIFFLTILTSSLNLSAVTTNIIPKPRVILENSQNFTLKGVEKDLDKLVKVVINENLSLKKELDKELGNKASSFIIDSLCERDGYVLELSKKEIVIKAKTQRGVQYAKVTLKRLVKRTGNDFIIPITTIIDWPEFAVRGFMHDVGRDFIEPEIILENLEAAALVKMNTFHWHLTENQGWRIESKNFPQLTADSSFSRKAGKFYSYEDVKRILAKCKELNIDVIPEIDMPGHSKAFTKGMGFDMQTDQGIEALKVLLTEYADLFKDSKYIHIGTDEVHFRRDDFIKIILPHIESLGKKVISWSPGYKYSPGEVDALQLWSVNARKIEGIPSIDCRNTYANHHELYTDIIDVYNAPLSWIQKGERATDKVLGSIMCFWTDRALETSNDIISQNGFYPFLLTLAEVTWSYPNMLEQKFVRGESFNSFNLSKNGDNTDNKAFLDSFTEFEERLIKYREDYFDFERFPYIRQTQSKWRVSAPIFNDKNLEKEFPIEKNFTETTKENEFKYNDSLYKVYDFIGNTLFLRHTWGGVLDIPSPVYGREETLKAYHTAYASTSIFVPKGGEYNLYLSFQDYSRSEKDLAPLQGAWDYKKSFCMINGEKIAPPTWENTHTVPSNEITLKNENWQNRAVKVVLKQGWNTILLKMPVGVFQTKEVRLVKWMGTCFFTDLENREIDGLIYDPYR